MSRKFLPGAPVALASLCISSLAIADDKPQDVQTVVVTASPLSDDPDFLATIVDSVNRDQILRKGGANLADALNDVPGVTGTTFASGASRPVIRGFDANRVRTLEDGIGSFDVADVGPDHGVPIDPLSADRVEVVRGAATLRYGSQAIGGVVNAINNRVPTELPDKPILGEITGSYGTNSDSRQGAAEIDARAGQFAFHADGFDRHTEDYDTPEGKLSNSFFRGNGAAFGSSYFFGQNRVGANVIHYDTQYGIPGEDSFIDMRQTKEMFRSSFAIGAGALQTLTVEGGYADYEHSERDPDGAALATFKDNEWDSRAEGIFGQLGPFSAAALGVQAQKRNFSALGEAEDYLRPTTTQTEALFAFSEAPLPGGNARLQLGARVERVQVDGTPASDIATSRELTPVSGSVGVVFDATEAVRLGATVTSAARAPAQTELFARGPHDGPATFETGDPALDIERATSLEGSVRVRMENVRFDGSVWGAKFNNYIFGALTGRTCDEEGACVDDDSGELKELNYAQLGAKFWGAEGKATIGLHEGTGGTFEGILLADFVRARLDEGAGNVPRIPPYHLGAGLNWTAGSFDGGVFVKYSGRQNRTATEETPTPGFTSVDAQLGWKAMKSTPGFEVALIGRNLTDSTQRNAVALNKDEVIMPGRDVRLVVRAAF
jgi:iron complex outermembrane recepter protein